MFIKPCNGYITSLYDKARKNPVTGKVQPHWGTDYGNHADNTIVAAAAGKVRIAVNSQTGFGKYIIITHDNGWETVYAHLSVISVNAGQSVKQGEKIGVKGTTGNSTGVHLHFEISKGKWSNKYTNHVDPVFYIDDPDVRLLQVSLNKLGYKVDIDGIYGVGTINAVASYQRANKLTADGVAGNATMAAVAKSVSQIHIASNSKEENKMDQDKNAKPSPALAEEFAKAKEVGITDGTYPNRVATRAEVAVMNYRVYDSILKQLKK